MRIKIDENLPHELADVLGAMGHDADSVFRERLVGASDATLWRVVIEARRGLLPRDLDFADIRKFPPGSHHGNVLVRMADSRRTSLLARVREAFLRGSAHDWQGCHIVIGDHTLRIRRPS